MQTAISVSCTVAGWCLLWFLVVGMSGLLFHGVFMLFAAWCFFILSWHPTIFGSKLVIKSKYLLYVYIFLIYFKS